MTPRIRPCCSFVPPALPVLPLLLCVLGGCTAERRAPSDGTVPTDGWQAQATLAGRGGLGGEPARWGFAAAPGAAPDQTAPRVLEIPSPKDQTYNIFWQPNPLGASPLADVELSVRVQARSGVVDQGGGPIWRVQDRDTYYICRINPLESNFRVYKVVAGVRTQLGSVKVDSPAATADAPGAWHTITVRHVGDRILCAVDGTAELDVTDAAISQPGGVGVWTKADAVTWFERLTVSPATVPADAK